MVVIGSKSVDLFSLAVGVVNVTSSTDLDVFNITSHLVGNTESTPLIDIHVNFLSFSVCEIKATFILSNWKFSTIAKLILVEAERILLEMDIDVLWCNARVLAVQFYEKCGFKVVGSDFDIRLIGQHFVMYKKLEK